ncbi:hypothetical protein [Kineosporia babensis]|uniref:Uncharacterized protein n=1 Tax=Kineosporia babensis TaxID=499548 RepID=A0A9X1NN95_9ACTN|nr:hypothetical protein [Kineosporia babensis]MCD5316859.1 hypothetical protein [Kineosporia babensis]
MHDGAADGRHKVSTYADVTWEPAATDADDKDVQDLLQAIDGVLDYLVPAWETLITQTPQVLEAVTSDPRSVASGLHMGLQTTWVLSHQFMSLPGHTLPQRLAYQAAARSRWALTLHRFSAEYTVTDDDFASGHAQSDMIQQLCTVLNLLAEAQSIHRQSDHAGAVARALVHLAHVVRGLGHTSVDEHQDRIEALQHSLAGVLERHGYSLQDQATPTAPVWQPAMSLCLQRHGDHPLWRPVMDLVDALGDGMNARAEHENLDKDWTATASAVVLGCCLNLIVTATLDPNTLAAASVFGRAPFSPDRSLLWSPRDLQRLADQASDPDLHVLLEATRLIGSAEVAHPRAMAGMTARLSSCLDTCLDALMAAVSATPSTFALRQRFADCKAAVLHDLERAALPSPITEMVRDHINALPSVSEAHGQRQQIRQQDHVIDIYMAVRRLVLAWFAVADPDEQISRQERRFTSQQVLFGLCAPLFNELSPDLDSWLLQRTTHGNAHSELEGFDPPALRRQAEETLIALLSMAALALTSGGRDLDSAIASSLELLSMLATFFDRIITAVAPHDPPDALMSAVDAAGLAQIGERTVQRILHVLGQGA